MSSDEEKKLAKKKKKKDKKKHKKRKHEETKDSPSNEDVVQASTEKKAKKLKKSKKEKKSKKKDDVALPSQKIRAVPNKDDVNVVGGRIVSFSAQDINTKKDTSQNNSTTLLLFYQYIEPVLDEDGFRSLLYHVQTTGDKYNITGRMRTAYEGLNCTLTGSYDNIRAWCKDLREYENGKYFGETEFKLTDNLPSGQAFPRLHAFKVEEIVNYGLNGVKAPSIHMTGVHLEPKDYHKKMMEDETVIIDVRNHYEAAIGKFQPPDTGAKYIDPMMRKSTEFPVWLDKPETKEMLRGKQVSTILFKIIFNMR